MRLVIAALATLALAAAATAGCTINHRTSEYACAQHGDCAQGRVCSGGFCVVSGVIPDAPTADARPPDAPTTCPEPCTNCNFETMQCNVDCPLEDCESRVVCPAGWNCYIECRTPDSCRAGVDCRDAASCDIQCLATNSCRGVVCGPGKCNVHCAGTNSCQAIGNIPSVTCGPSCACDVTCQPLSSCASPSCTSAACDPPGRGCSSTPAGCNTCAP